MEREKQRAEFEQLLKETESSLPVESPIGRPVGMREYPSGATRSPKGDKLEFAGFLSPIVWRRFAEYMHKHRLQEDGKLRASDNWQKGMPLSDYMDSGMRHFMDWWLIHRGYKAGTEDVLEALSALMFNIQGYMHEVLLGRQHPQARQDSNKQLGESDKSKFRGWAVGS